MARKSPTRKSKKYSSALQVYTPNQEDVIRRFDKLSREEQENVLIAALRWVYWFFTGSDVGRQEPPDKPEK